jgi:cardiolipin synthase
VEPAVKKKPAKKTQRVHKYVEIPLVALLVLIFAIIVLVIAVWSGQRGQEAHLHVRNAGELGVLLPSIVGLTESSLDAGNRVEVLENGDGFFPRLLADIAAARESVHVESYIWWSGDICKQIAAALAAKAQQGVEVRLLVDASGGHKMDRALEKQMRGAGVHFAFFRPLSLSRLGRMNSRDHRKLAVIDGRIGYVGGYGYAKEWTGHAQDRNHFRDTGLRIEGPVINRLQGAFCENWIEQTGEVLAGEKYFPKLAAAGASAAHVAYTSPSGGTSSVQVLYYLAIAAARREIVIQNPYMLPDDDAIGAMAQASKRGVRINVMVPATSATDSPIVQHASHHIYESMLRAGAHIYEYKRTLLHQKIIIVDGVWSCVGSTNFDDRSFQRNDEISVGVLDRRVASELHAAFDDDLREAVEIKLEVWRRRSFLHKWIDGIAYLGNPQL